MLDADAAEELEQLKCNLEKARENYIEKWTGKSREEARERLFEFHISKLQSEQENIDKLEEDVKTKKEEIMKHTTASTENKNNVAQIKKEVADLKETEKSMNQSINDTIAKVKDMTEATHKKKEAVYRPSTWVRSYLDIIRDLALDRSLWRASMWQGNPTADDPRKQSSSNGLEVTSLEKTISTKQAHFTRALEFFRNRLGLSIRKGESGELQFTFTLIDEKDWNKEFTFSVKIEEDNTYNILRCDPYVEQIEEYKEQLNKTNDFSKFVTRIRTSFKSLVEHSENQKKGSLKECQQNEAAVVSNVLEELTNRISGV